ncbi:hypothetical protein [Paenibacillus bouchesdurhonensis]|uniref:hypothetical protein n=1 Tax=Paenibacillus bouchesdurhonensis TaxID=1870990 RepID=UPI000DA5EC56|nr:hypothetical protein [Paenibacillus bouchesdurhonensis]
MSDFIVSLSDWLSSDFVGAAGNGRGWILAPRYRLPETTRQADQLVAAGRLGRLVIVNNHNFKLCSLEHIRKCLIEILI